jgi:hypothetical protein
MLDTPASLSLHQLLASSHLTLGWVVQAAPDSHQTHISVSRYTQEGDLQTSQLLQVWLLPLKDALLRVKCNAEVFPAELIRELKPDFAIGQVPHISLISMEDFNRK